MVRNGPEEGDSMFSAEELLAAFRAQILEHGISWILGALLFAVGLWWGTWRASSAWSRKEFFDRLNVSLNSIQSNTLLIRTILEKSAQDVFLNRVATDKVLAAAKQTTPENPLLPLAPNDRWYLLNAVLNEVAERFSAGEIRKDLASAWPGFNRPVTEKYLICLTNEADGEIRTRKVRAMLVREALLLNLPSEQPALESPHHLTRWKTLQAMARAYRSDPSLFIALKLTLDMK